MIDWRTFNRELREVTRKHFRDEAIRVALRPHPWFWYYTSEARNERDLQRWADDGGRV